MKWVKWPLRALIAAALLAAIGVVWLLGTESGLRWALRFAPPEVELTGTRGTLAGAMFFDRVAYQGSEALNVSLDLNLLALAADTIAVDFVRIETLHLKRPEGSREQKGSIAFRLRVAEAEVRSLVYEGYEIHDLRASYKGGTSGHEAEASFGAAGARARVSAVLGLSLIHI